MDFVFFIYFMLDQCVPNEAIELTKGLLYLLGQENSLTFCVNMQLATFITAFKCAVEMYRMLIVFILVACPSKSDAALVEGTNSALPRCLTLLIA
jgi:hypothetical protein